MDFVFRFRLELIQIAMILSARFKAVRILVLTSALEKWATSVY